MIYVIQRLSETDIVISVGKFNSNEKFPTENNQK